MLIVINYKMDLSYPFDVEIILFDKNIDLTNDLIHIRDNLIKNDINQIIQMAIKNKYKLILSNENIPTIASHDERKQLTLSIQNTFIELPKYKYSIYFIQKHSNKDYFTIPELKEIVDGLKEVIEKYLGCVIDDPIIFLDTGCL